MKSVRSGNFSKQNLEEDPSMSLPILRDFDAKLSQSKNLFSGYYVSTYDRYVMRDEIMQKIILRDQLLVLMDKLSIMKNSISEKNIIKNIVRFLPDVQLVKLNRKFEHVIGIMDKLVKLLLFDMIDKFEDIGLETTPLNLSELNEKFYSEKKT